MTTDIKADMQKWADVLINNNLPQCRVTLKNRKGERCCLGVYVEEVKGVQVEELQRTDLLDDSYAKDIEEFFGCKQNVFSALNDACLLTFPQIGEALVRHIDGTQNLEEYYNTLPRYTSDGTVYYNHS